MRVPEIAEKMNLSESGVYRVIQMDRVREIPTIDDSNTVKELKERIRKLEEENENLRNDVRRLTDKLLSLI